MPPRPFTAFPTLGPRTLLPIVLATAAPLAAQHGPDPLIAPFPDAFDLGILPIDSPAGPAGSLGFTFEGGHEQQYMGISIAPAGDVNGDGVDDIVVQSQGSSLIPIEGEAFVVFGGPGGPGALLGSGAIDGANGFRFTQPTGSQRIGAAGIGDFNGDGVGDFLVGWHDASPYGRAGAGSAIVMFGPAVPDGRPVLDLSTIPSDAGQWIHGGQPEESLAYRVAPAGDANGDGLADVLMTASVSPVPGASRIDVVYVVYGRRADASGAWPAIDLETLEPDEGTLLYHRYGGLTAIAGVGDLDSDGYDDVAMTWREGSASARPFVGMAFVIYGGAVLPTTIDATRPDAPYATRIEGAELEGRIGSAIAGIGDLDGDGSPDLAIGADVADKRPGGYANGRAYVLFGPAAGERWPAVIDLADPAASGAPEPLVIRSDGLGERVGSAVAGPGDLDGDGLPDLVVGARNVRPPLPATPYERSGASVVIYGRNDGRGAAGFGGSVEIYGLAAPVGAMLRGRETGASGVHLAPAGDFNGDGRPDLIIADYTHPVEGRRSAGEVQVVYGRKPCPANLDGDDRLSVLDFLTFQNFFALGDARADFDGDGELTVVDFLAFQSSFDAGCE